MAECTPFTIPVTDDNRGISGKDASFLGDVNNASDRANQDRYLAGEFRTIGVSSAERGERHALSAVSDARWLCDKFDHLSKDVERNGRSAELATEKTAAATMLAVERAAAAAALCCCETDAKIAASTASILAALKQSEVDNIRQQLTVFQVRAGVLASPG